MAEDTEPGQDTRQEYIRAAARRALEEAKRRENAAAMSEDARPREINGREGPDPVRYGDWENKGILSDF